MPLLTTGAGAYPAAAAGGVTFDPANKGAAIVLSNGNLTASNSNAGNTDASVKSTTSHSTGKFYFEFTIVSTTRMLLGVGNTAATLTGFVGSTADGAGFFDSTGAGFGSLGGVSLTAGYVAGNVVCIALDATNSLIFGRINGGFWNNSGSADPVTGVGGGSTAGLGGGAVFVMASPANNATSVTVNFGATSYAQTPPSGFGNW